MTGEGPSESVSIRGSLTRLALLGLGCGVVLGVVTYLVTDRDGAASGRLAALVGAVVAVLILLLGIVGLARATQARLDALVAGERARGKRIRAAILRDQVDDLSEANRHLVPQWAAESARLVSLAWLINILPTALLASSVVLTDLSSDPGGGLLSRWLLAVLAAGVLIGAVVDGRRWHRFRRYAAAGSDHDAYARPSPDPESPTRATQG